MGQQVHGCGGLSVVEAHKYTLSVCALLLLSIISVSTFLPLTTTGNLDKKFWLLGNGQQIGTKQCYT